MTEEHKIGEGYARLGSDSFNAVVRSWDGVNKGFQAIAEEVTDYTKKAFEDANHAFQQLIGAKSPEQVIEIQSQYAQTYFDAYVARMSKLSELYVAMARDVSKPITQVPID
jgi:phasin family protein